MTPTNAINFIFELSSTLVGMVTGHDANGQWQEVRKRSTSSVPMASRPRTTMPLGSLLFLVGHRPGSIAMVVVRMLPF